MTERTVLIDLTPLDTPSRWRGTGRYLRALSSGLSKLSDTERQGLRVLGLTRLGWDGSFEVTEDVGAFEGHKELEHPTEQDHYRVSWAKRMGLWRAVRAIRPDLVHLGDPQGTPLLRTATRCRWVVTCMDLIPMQYPERYFSARDGGVAVGRMIARRRYASADHVVAISEATKHDLVRFFGMAPERISRVYNGVDLEAWRKEPGLGAREAIERHGLWGKRYLLYVGDTDWRKNVEGMIEGIAWARARGSDVVLALAGVLSEARARRVDQLAREAQVQEQVVRLGFVSDDDLLALYRGALAHLFVSRAEGFGLTVVEAMAAGCPVITTRRTSLAEVAGQAALLVDPEDAGDIGAAITKLASSEPERARLVELGREQAGRFSMEAQGRGMIEVWKRVMGGSLSAGG
ncbi:MAG TPA: glycosyltransferase family 1 protein [Polyangiaceae bacterium]|nr:glycosyltransferase family 1 protein [Polyangiaceae bacterium]